MDNEFNIAHDLHNMTPGDSGDATAKVIYKSDDGIMRAYGTTVPTDATAGYAPGCVFHHTDADTLFSGTVDSGDATSLLDATLTATFDTDDELIGLYVINERNQTMGLISDYAQSTGDITVADWTDYDGTAVANAAPYLPVAGDTFRVLRVSTKVAIYVNSGDRARGCKFRPLVDTYGGGYAVTEMQVGPSESIWGDCPVLDVMLDPGKGIYYFEDYMGEIDVTTADGWTITTVTSGQVIADVDVEGGVIIFDTNGNAGADDGINAQLANCCVIPAAGTTIYFEARVQMTDTGDDQYFIGLSGADTTIIAAGIMDATVSKVGFYRIAASTADKISTITEKTTVADATADVATIADTTWVKLGFVIDGVTSVKFYVNGQLVETGATLTTIPAVAMALSYVSQVEQTSADAELKVDWVRIVSVGGRN